MAAFRIFCVLLLGVVVAAHGANTPCSGKKGGISHCDNGLFVCNDGSVSKSQQRCDRPPGQPDGSQPTQTPVLFPATVIAVKDGDTILAKDTDGKQWTVRLSGIDAPELAQAFGADSRNSLSDLVNQRKITVSTTKTDKYGRTVGSVRIGDQDINLEQVRRGLAWHYTAYQAEQSKADQAAYANAERQARAAKAGLWSAPSPTPPWAFRHPGKSL